VSKSRIYLSPPYTDSSDLDAITEAIKSGWIAPVGPQLNQFEQQLTSQFGFSNVLGVTSGTSALHIAIRLAGIQQGDQVLVGTFTFIAVANALLYEKAVPVFIDSDQDNWNLCPELLRDYLASHKKPKAVIATHIFGIPARIDEIKAICAEYQVILIEDAAEALGSRYQDMALGSFGEYAALSFNGNKIITTSGGGALICQENGCHQRALFVATQARDDADHFSHSEMGFNYRMSNLLAGLGLGQLSKFDWILQRKFEIHHAYRQKLENAGVKFYEESSEQYFNHWITPIIMDGIHPSEALLKFQEQNIEVRRFWKPLHLQPLCSQFDSIEGEVASDLFDTGICLPGGVGMTEEDIERVCSVLLSL
tara:strand:+ start:1370 stop:2467 length:1098 start_codon:yes stop_codon:yes gene_type:complete